jgi:adenosylcobinamide kinase/adenosylcobinamide-phosphate guanylyltransferase
LERLSFRTAFPVALATVDVRSKGDGRELVNAPDLRHSRVLLGHNPTGSLRRKSPVLKLHSADRRIFVLGGARSGKSRYAEQLIAGEPPPRIFIATAEALDAEMAERIAHHRTRRNDNWRTVEAPRDLAGALGALPAEAAALIDCVTLWLSNLLLAGADVEAEISALDQVLMQSRNKVVLVGNEVGCGIVPDNALARRFRDLQGSLNQRLAARADRVVLVVAGLPMLLKGQP